MTKSGQPPKSFTTDTRVVRKNVAPASRRHLSLDNSFWVNTTFAGWKPAIHFFSPPRSTRRGTENPDASVKSPCPPCLRGETGRLAAPGSLSESQLPDSSGKKFVCCRGA